jgi:hypothetical protein
MLKNLFRTLTARTAGPRPRRLRPADPGRKRLGVLLLEDRVVPALPFSGVPAPFTQELVATTAVGGAISGYAFDAQNNPYFQDLSNLHIYEVDLANTITSHGSTIHPLIDKGLTTFAASVTGFAGQQVQIGNFTQYPDGSIWANTNRGVLKIDLATGKAVTAPIPGTPRASGASPWTRSSTTLAITTLSIPLATPSIRSPASASALTSVADSME